MAFHQFSVDGLLPGAQSFPLAGIKVLELEGIGPGPLGCCMLADFGKARSQNDPVSRGKRSIALDLKSPAAIATFRRLVKSVDVVVEPFRPGVMEKLGLGPDVLCGDNPRLIYARMTGWGQMKELLYDGDRTKKISHITFGFLSAEEMRRLSHVQHHALIADGCNGLQQRHDCCSKSCMHTSRNLVNDDPYQMPGRVPTPYGPLDSKM
eukprot:gene4371-27116_t